MRSRPWSGSLSRITETTRSAVRTPLRAELIACITLTWASPVSTNRVFTESGYGTHVSDRFVEARNDTYGSEPGPTGKQ